MIEEGERVACLGRDGVGCGAGPGGGTAAAVVHPDQAAAGEMGREIIEVMHRPGQPGEAEERQALALIGKGEAGAVGGGEETGFQGGTGAGTGTASHGASGRGRGNEREMVARVQYRVTH